MNVLRTNGERIKVLVTRLADPVTQAFFLLVTVSILVNLASQHIIVFWRQIIARGQPRQNETENDSTTLRLAIPHAYAYFCMRSILA